MYKEGGGVNFPKKLKRKKSVALKRVKRSWFKFCMKAEGKVGAVR